MDDACLPIYGIEFKADAQITRLIDANKKRDDSPLPTFKNPTITPSIANTAGTHGLFANPSPTTIQIINPARNIHLPISLIDLSPTQLDELKF